MNWTQDQFFSWAEVQDARYESDGMRPVAMTGGNVGHSLITQNVQAALRARLGEVWRTSVLTSDEVLEMPEIGVAIPVTEFYEDITFL